ncbi:MAG: hypothetical protein LBN11_03110, partial [Tannerella sp.]|nr:hypothetical protein [Tannerella sp.]
DIITFCNNKVTKEGTNKLAEVSTKDISQVEEPANFEESKSIAKRSGKIAGDARKALALFFAIGNLAIKDSAKKEKFNVHVKRELYYFLFAQGYENPTFQVIF